MTIGLRICAWSLKNNGFVVSLGRMDKNLDPFYKKDKESGVLTEEDENELLSSFFLENFPVGTGIQNWDSAVFRRLSNLPEHHDRRTGRERADCRNDLTFRLLKHRQKITCTSPRFPCAITTGWETRC